MHDVHVAAETGFGKVGTYGAGISAFVSGAGNIYTKAGYAVCGLVGQWRDVPTAVESGYGVSGLVGAGASASVNQETGYGTVGTVGSGASASVFQKSGYGTAGLSAPGLCLRLHESGYGTVGTYGSAPSASADAQAGAGFVGLVGAGSGEWILNRTGYGKVGAAGYGTGTKSTFNIYTKEGFGSVGLVGAGASASIPQETGAGIAGLVGSGTSTSLTQETGAGIAGTRSVSGVVRIHPPRSRGTGRSERSVRGQCFRHHRDRVRQGRSSGLRRRHQVVLQHLRQVRVRSCGDGRCGGQRECSRRDRRGDCGSGRCGFQRVRLRRAWLRNCRGRWRRDLRAGPPSTPRPGSARSGWLRVVGRSEKARRPATPSRVWSGLGTGGSSATVSGTRSSGWSGVDEGRRLRRVGVRGRRGRRLRLRRHRGVLHPAVSHLHGKDRRRAGGDHRREGERPRSCCHCIAERVSNGGANGHVADTVGGVAEENVEEDVLACT